eukprot:7070181-Prymnesium_polylepis.2
MEWKTQNCTTHSPPMVPNRGDSISRSSVRGSALPVRCRCRLSPPGPGTHRTARQGYRASPVCGLYRTVRCPSWRPREPRDMLFA